MRGTPDITATGFIYSAIALIVVLILVYVKGGKSIAVTSAVAMVRMSVQLTLVGLYLSWLFKLDNPLLTAAWLVIMLGAANFSILQHSGLALQLFFPLFAALLITLLTVLGWFILLVFTTHQPVHARLVVPIAGMLLGNSMNRTIITIDRFYSSLIQNEGLFSESLAMGATIREAATPFFREAYRAGMAPVLASYAAMGLVSLPGMMTGAILGGATPGQAVKYQIVIIIAIFASTELATLFSLLFTAFRGFHKNGMPDRTIFANRKLQRKKHV